MNRLLRLHSSRPSLLLLSAILLGILLTIAEARVGGGQSYSGSSRSSSSSSSTGGSEGIGALIYLFLALPRPLQIFLVLAILAFKIYQKSGPTVVFNAQTSPRNRLPILPPSWGQQGRTIDPTFSEVLFLERASLLITRTFEASTNPANLDALSPYLTPEIATTIAARHQGAHAVRGVVIGSIAVAHVRSRTSPDATPNLSVQVNLRLNRHLQFPAGSQRFYSQESWEFLRKIGAPARAEESLDRLGCPGCGSPLERDPFGRCVHCSTLLLPGASDWSVQSITVLSEEPQKPQTSLLADHAAETGTPNPTAKDPDVQSQITALLPDHESPYFTERASAIFTNLQSAWNSRNLNALRPFETDSLWQSHRFWIEEYYRQNLRNCVEEVQIHQIVICRVERDAQHLVATCRIFASCLDYTIQEPSQSLLSGSKTIRRDFSEYWTFIKHHDATKPSDLQNCPSCGAKLAISQSGSCDYCQSKLTLGRFDWVASRIAQD